jgi:hypothetical protein
VKSSPLSRRAVLRGVGASLALPWLEVMAPQQARAQTQAAPLRFAMVYSPNGFLMDKWTPATTGTGWATPPLLQALAPFRDDFNVLSGLGNYTASIAPEFGGSHTRATGSYLTQCPLGGTVRMAVKNGISLDQILAQAIGRQTRFPSLQVGSRASSATGTCEDNYACAYNNNLSWASPTMFLPKQVNPRDVFDRLFGDGGGARPGMPGPVDHRAFYGKSILDVVAGRADQLRQRVGRADRNKLDEYFTSVREVEKRLDGLAGATIPGQPGVTVGQCAVPAAPRDSSMGPIPFAEHLDMLSDLIALAFQCDVTRVATYMFEHSFSDARNFGFLGVTRGHHQLSHSRDFASLEKIDRFYVERFAYLLGKLKAMNEGDRTVLDNSIIYFGSEFGDGGGHDHRELALLVAGKAGGRWKTGLHVDYPLHPDEGTGVDGVGNPLDTQLAHLHLTTLRAFGQETPTFGVDGKGMPMATRPLGEFVL